MLLLPGLLVALGLLLPRQEPAPPTPAAELLAKAELSASKGKYAEARRLYRELAQKFPDTPEGAIGERRSRPSAFLAWAPLTGGESGANRVDIAILAEGWTLEHQKAFDKLAADIPKLFERQKTFREYFRYLRFLRVNLVSAEEGIDGFGREYDTALNAHMIGTIAGNVAVDDAAVHEMLAQLPEHDNLAIVYVKREMLGTGGGGIAVIGGRSTRTTMHEWGHAFADLADEYSTKTHERGAASNAVNSSNTPDPQRVPWKHWIEAGVRGIGVYEGAQGRARGAWKPTSGGCVMENGAFYCPVCREEIVLRIHRYVDPIERCDPPPHALDSPEEIELGPKDQARFALVAMRPQTHSLEARWWVLPAERAPADPRPQAGDHRRPGDRRSRGPLAPIEDKPDLVSKGSRDGRHEFELEGKELAPGRYRVVCRVTDRTEVRGERDPWVLRDPDGLLTSERAWWVRVGERESP